jgi:hypothetical protein
LLFPLARRLAIAFDLPLLAQLTHTHGGGVAELFGLGPASRLYPGLGFIGHKDDNIELRPPAAPLVPRRSILLSVHHQSYPQSAAQR